MLLSGSGLRRSSRDCDGNTRKRATANDGKWVLVTVDSTTVLEELRPFLAKPPGRPNKISASTKRSPPQKVFMDVRTSTLFSSSEKQFRRSFNQGAFHRFKTQAV